MQNIEQMFDLRTRQQYVLVNGFVPNAPSRMPLSTSTFVDEPFLTKLINESAEVILVPIFLTVARCPPTDHPLKGDPGK